MCYWSPYTLRKEDVLERLMSWIGVGLREGFPMPTCIDIGPDYLDIIGGEQELNTPWGKVWLYHGKKALL